MKAAREAGLARIVRYAGWQAFQSVLDRTPTPVLRVAVLRAAGARIGAGTVIQPGLRLQNLDRSRGPRLLVTGRDCWFGYDVQLDLAAPIELGDDVTIASRVMVSTHLNVGHANHPLQAHLPAYTSPVTVGRGSWVGSGAMLTAGVRLGPLTAVAAGAVVLPGSYEGGVLLGGTPARVLRSWG